MYRHTFQKRIRYGETDQMGYLYYGNYPLLYEIGRSEAIRSLGFSYKQMEEEMQIMMPVLAVNSRYMLPVRYDEKITIVTILEELPSKLITFKHEILGENGALTHKAEVKLFFIDMNTQKRVSIPSLLKENLATYFD